MTKEVKPNVKESKSKKPDKMSDTAKAVISKGIGEVLTTAMAKNRDPREVAYSKLVDYLYDTEKILMVIRSNAERADVILKNYILVDFYQNYYSNCEVEIKLERVMDDEEKQCMCKRLNLKIGKKCPHCKGKGLYKEGLVCLKPVQNYSQFSKEMRDTFLGCYEKFIIRYCELTVSDGGLGREDILKILKAGDDQMSKKDELMNWARDKLS